MPGSSGTIIVRQALEAQRAHPEWSALELLDAVMERHRGSHPDFECDHPEYSHDVDPASPFGEILRQVFAPGVASAEFALLDGQQLTEVQSARAAELEVLWDRVIDQFAERYELWSA
jgi:hypothetical protein